MTPTGEVVYGPMLDERFARSFERILGWIAPHHTVLGSTSIGRITAAAPREGFAGDPSKGLFYHPVLLDGVRPEDTVFTEEAFGPVAGVTRHRTLDEATGWPTRRATDCRPRCSLVIP